MSDRPAAWYDDPEDATQYRYWDGNQWTEHRSPKQAPPPAGSPSEPPPGSPSPTTKKPWWKRWWGIAIIAFIALTILGGLLGDPETDGDPAATDTEAAGETEEPATEDEPTEAEEPEEPAEPATLEDRIDEALGDSNRDVEPRFTVSRDTPSEGVDELVIRWAINDNLTEGMIKTSAKIDATDILEVVATQDGLEYDQVFLIGTFSMVDQMGNAEEDEVIMATYPRDTVRSINFDNFLHDNVWDIANQDSLFIHPAFRE